jgi:hypothetical protein
VVVGHVGLHGDTDMPFEIVEAREHLEAGVEPPVTPWRTSVSGSWGSAVGSSSPLPKGEGIQSMSRDEAEPG